MCNHVLRLRLLTHYYLLGMTDAQARDGVLRSRALSEAVRALFADAFVPLLQPRRAMLEQGFGFDELERGNVLAAISVELGLVFRQHYLSVHRRVDQIHRQRSLHFFR